MSRIHALASTARLVLGVVGGLVLGMTSSAHAGGFYLTDRGTRTLGRGFAFVAGADDPQALAYNPAGLSFSGQQLLFDATITLLDAEFTRVDSGGNELPTVGADPHAIPIPMLAYSHPLREDLTLGLGVFAPNASLLDWPLGIDAEGGRCDPYAGVPGCEAAPQRYSLITLDGTALAHLTAGVGWMPVDGLSIGAGAQIMVGSFQAQTVMSACDGVVCAQPENPEYDGVAKISLSPIIEPGLMFGVIYDAGLVRIGGSMLWWPKAIRGDAKLDVRLPQAALYDGATLEGDTAALTIDFPLTLRAGVEVRPVDGLRIEGAIVWEHWSTQQAISLQPKNMWIRNLNAIGDYQVGNLDVPRNMNDVWSARLGIEYDALFDQRLAVRAGFNYENSSFDDATLSPLTLDSDKFIIGLGASVQVTDGLWIDASYGLVSLKDRNVTNSQVTQPNPIRPPRSPDVDPNDGGVVHIGNGRYTMNAHMLGIGLRWQLEKPPLGASFGSGAATETSQTGDDETDPPREPEVTPGPPAASPSPANDEEDAPAWWEDP